MKLPRLLRSAVILALLTCSAVAFAADPGPAESAPAAKSAEFLIVLRLTPKYHDSHAWNDEADKIVGAHFARLKEATARGQVILAGRTNEPHDKTIGLIVFTAENEAAARKFMDEDPCVAGGVMTGTLHSYSVALLRK